MDRLMAALQFDAGDLAENRRGRLGAGSAQHLKRRWTTNGVWAASGLIFFLLAWWLAQAESLSSLPVILIFALFIGGGLLVIGFNLHRIRLIRGDLSRGAVETIRGEASLVETYGGRTTVYSLGIGGERFRVQKKVFEAFTNHEPYAIYYAPLSRTLVAAERLDR